MLGLLQHAVLLAKGAVLVAVYSMPCWQLMCKWLMQTVSHTNVQKLTEIAENTAG
jgi:hypothetical protein